jgi:hypothetical protein
MLRILIITAAIAALMFAVKDGRVLARAGLVGSCTDVVAPLGDGGAWQACRAGPLEGRPDLSRRSCSPQGLVREVEYWRCPTPLAGRYSTD